MRAFLAAHWPVAADRVGTALWDRVVQALGWPVTDDGGPWRVATTLDNVASAEESGPYRWPAVAGPASSTDTTPSTRMNSLRFTPRLR